jgi:hypothetical protein
MPTTNVNVSGQGIIPEIKLEGDWAKALQLIGHDLSALVLKGAYNGQVAAAEKLKVIVKNNIRSGGPQSIYWPNYSLMYGERKAKAGAGDKKWRYTDTYYKSITVTKHSMNKVSVGVPKNERSKVNQNPLTLGQVAVILERGSRVANIAARPLWGPSWKEFGGKKRVAYHINWHIRKILFEATGLRGLKFK